MNLWFHEEMVQWNDRNDRDSLTYYFNLFKENQNKNTNSLLADAYLLMAENRIRNNDIENAKLFLDSVSEDLPQHLYAKMKRCIIVGENDKARLLDVYKEFSSVMDYSYKPLKDMKFNFVFYCICNNLIEASEFIEFINMASSLSDAKIYKLYGHAMSLYEDNNFDPCVSKCNEIIGFQGNVALYALLLKAKCLLKKVKLKRRC